MLEMEKNPEAKIVVEPSRIDKNIAASIAVRTYCRGWFKRVCDATPLNQELIYIPYWIGQGRLILRSAFGEHLSRRLFACDGWKGDPGVVQGTLPQFSLLDIGIAEHVVSCRITAEQAAGRIKEQSFRFASGRFLTAQIHELSLELIYKPYWAIKVRTGAGHHFWRLVSADVGMVTYRFDPELEDMLKDARVLS